MFEGFSPLEVDVDGIVIRGVMGGEGPPLLLLHGYPQTHVMWHRIAPDLARHFRVVIPDLRGYGDSDKPPSDPTHTPYSFRAMANDQVGVMKALGYDRFHLCGHDRGARTAHRMALDHPNTVESMALLDIVPTLHVYDTIDQRVATGYYHWFFLIQPAPLPETLIGADPAFYLRAKTGQWSRTRDCFDPAAMAEYERCFSDPACIHATCEDYRAGASVDLEFDRADMGRKVAAPTLALWGARGLVGTAYDVLKVWRTRCESVQGKGLDCGHFLPEEAPEETLSNLLDFFKDGLRGPTGTIK